MSDTKKVNRDRRARYRKLGVCISGDGARIAERSKSYCERCLHKYRNYHRRPDRKAWAKRLKEVRKQRGGYAE